jgi:hypothetical protein
MKHLCRHGQAPARAPDPCELTSAGSSGGRPGGGPSTTRESAFLRSHAIPKSHEVRAPLQGDRHVPDIRDNEKIEAN